MSTNQYLLIRSRQTENVYGPFTKEILVSEGLMGFETVDLDESSLPTFEPDDLVILTRCFLRRAEIEELFSAVEKGIRLVCFQPSYGLATKFGLVNEKQVIHPGWVRISEGHPGSGLPLQTHSPITLFDAPEWEVIAEATTSDWSNEHVPAVVHREIGKGKVAIFFYDLPLAVARIRFGDPELASYCTTGVWSWLHAIDLFQGHVDERVKHLPQADSHGQLLAKVVTDICAYPLARLWYYPESKQKSAAVFESDDDHSTPQQFGELSDSLAAHEATGTFYLMKDTYLSDETVKEMRAMGHTFAPHVNPHNSKDEWYYAFPDVLREETRLFKERFGECSQSIQCHCAPWQGYMDWVPTFIQLGYRLLFAYLSAPIQMLNGYMCGSGRPIRFYDTDGTLHDCWQQPLLSYDDTTLMLLMQEKGFEEVTKGFDSEQQEEGFRGMITAIVTKGDTKIKELGLFIYIEVPKVNELFSPFVVALPLQLIAYMVAKETLNSTQKYAKKFY